MDTLSGVIFVLIGPGGAGKNVMMKDVQKQFSDLEQLATATTRDMRAGEQEGREHLFVSLEQFKQMIANKELLEYQEVTKDRYYGIPRHVVKNCLAQGKVLIADIEVLGAQALVKEYGENVVQIFVTVPGDTLEESLKILKQRMEARADNSTAIQERMERAKSLELPYMSYCDYVIVNDTLEQAVLELTNIIKLEREKRQLVGEA